MVLLQSGLDNEWSADSKEWYCSLRNIQEHPTKGGSELPINGPVIAFGAMVEYHPKPAKNQSRLHQFGSTVLPGIFLGYALYAGRIWKGDVWSRTLKNWRRWTHLNSTPEGPLQRKCQRHKEVETSFSRSQMEQSKSWREDSV